jgi:hypothetical protein
MILKNLILEYVNDPYNARKNYNLGLYYYNIGQTASALSFFLRCAEWGDDFNLTYESLIMTGLCLSRQNRRQGSEMGVYLQAVRYNSNRPEAYYFLSLLQERRGEWLESNVNATLSFNLRNNACSTVYDFGWREYKAVFQRAVSAWWIGQIELSSDLFYELADKYGYDLDDSHKQSVLNNINFLKLYSHKHLTYYSNEYNKLKFKFNDSNKIERNFSQAMQDMFVLTMLNGKKSGTYLEIGSGHAFYGSNTAILDRIFNWKGISIDYNSDYKESYRDRNSIYLNDDALFIDYSDLLSKNNFPKDIDYLQLDCDPPEVTFNLLKKIPFDEYKFAVITFEHDYYTDSNSKYKDLSREYLISKGYQLVVNNIAPDRLCSFEDWWIHPDLVDKSIVDNFRIISNSAKKPTDFIYE